MVYGEVGVMKVCEMVESSHRALSVVGGNA